MDVGWHAWRSTPVHPVMHQRYTVYERAFCISSQLLWDFVIFVCMRGSSALPWSVFGWGLPHETCSQAQALLLSYEAGLTLRGESVRVCEVLYFRGGVWGYRM